MPIRKYPHRLEGIRIFLTRTLSVDDEYVRVFYKEYTEEDWDEHGEVEYDRATDVLLDYQEIVTRAALGELNALVEYELKWIAESVQRRRKEEPRQLSRGGARRIIEDEYGINLKDLPGFSEVDQVREIVNAYKHDDGYSGEYDSIGIGYMEKRYQLDPD